MFVIEKDIRRIAKLARIGINDQEVNVFKAELPNILGFFEQLKEVNTDNIEPLYSISDNKLILREDIVIEENNIEQILSNSSENEFNCFKVPKVIE